MTFCHCGAEVVNGHHCFNGHVQQREERFFDGESRQPPASGLAGGSAPFALDFITRLANAWDGRGHASFSGAECAALWALTYQGPYEKQPRWSEIEPHIRQRMVYAARAAIAFGRNCAGIFGE